MNIKTKYKNSKKQYELVKEILNNPKQPLKIALTKIGYSKSTINNPSRVLKKASFIELMERVGLTDNFLAKKVKEGFGSNKPVVIDKEIVDYPDNIARHKYLETALKVKKHLTPDTQIAIQANDYKVIITEDLPIKQ